VSPRLFASTFGIEARRLMSYRADFWINAVAGFVVHVGVAWFLWRAIFTVSGESEIGGFTFEGMLLYNVTVVLLGKLVRGQEFLSDVSQDIYEGGLSRYLVYPTNYVLLRYAQHLGNLVPALAQLLLFGATYPLLFPLPDGLAIGPAEIARAAGAVAVGNLLHYLLMLPIQMVAFWAENVWSLVVMMRMVATLLGGYLLPVTLFPGWVARAVEWTPFPYLYYFPVATLLGDVDAGEWAAGIAIALGWCAAMTGVSAIVWKRGRLSYTGVGM
jgi:ABC-2 type transport system permease protein